MRRREFMARAFPAAAAATGAAACARKEGAPAIQTRPHISWSLASSFPRGLDTIFGNCELLAKRIEDLSEGHFKIRVYSAGEIVPALQVLDAAQQGTVEVGQSASYYFTGKNPALTFDTGVPFGLTSRQQTAWLYEGEGLEHLRRLFADFNVVNFPAGNTGAQMGGWFKREIGSAPDLKGLKMRIPGLGGEVMHRLGVTVQVLPGGDIFPALERGAIDATEWVGPYDDEKLGFHRVAKHYYYPGWWEPGPSLSYYVNRRAWESLPSAYREIFSTAAIESAAVMQMRYDARNPAALARLQSEGVLLRRFSDDIMEAAQRIAFEILEEQAAADPAYRNLFKSWKKWRSESFGWFATAELAYAAFAFPGRPSGA